MNGSGLCSDIKFSMNTVKHINVIFIYNLFADFNVFILLTKNLITPKKKILLKN